MMARTAEVTNNQNLSTFNSKLTYLHTQGKAVAVHRPWFAFTGNPAGSPGSLGGGRGVLMPPQGAGRGAAAAGLAGKAQPEWKTVEGIKRQPEWGAPSASRSGGHRVPAVVGGTECQP